MDDYVEVYRDDAGEDRWRYKTANGEVLADSAEGYKNMADLMRSLGKVTGRVPTITETKGAPTPGPNAIRVVLIR